MSKNKKNTKSKKKPVKVQGKAVDLDLDKLITPTTLEGIAQAQKDVQAFANVHQNAFKQIAEMQKKLVEAYTHPFFEMQQRILKVYSLPMTRLVEDIQKMTSFQNTLAELASSTQKALSSIVLNSGITQISNMLKSIRVDAFAGLYITSEFKDRYETEHNGILEVSTLRKSKLLAGGQVQVDFDKSTQTNVKAKVAFQKIDQIKTKLDFMDENLSSTKEDTKMIKAILKDERGLLAVLQNNPFPYFKIASIEFHPKKSIFRVNKEITIPIPQYSMMENLCIVLFSGQQELGEEWYEDSIQEVWAALVDNEQGGRLTWKQILTTVDQINTLFAKKTTKDDLIIIERPKRIRLNPQYFVT
ncbi:MAG: hypothetical protein ABIE03_06230 [Patescibacteria group bacterium]